TFTLEREIVLMILTSMDAATVLPSGVVNVPTSSGSIPTASTPAKEQVPTGSDVVLTASPVFATATVSQQRKPWTKKQKRDYYMAVIRSNLGWKVKEFRVMTFEEVEAKFNSVWKQMEDFIPMGSKEEAERIKRKGINLVEINKLKERVKMLEDREGVAAIRSRENAPIKGRSIDEGEAATERISDDSEEMATILTSMDAATVLPSGVEGFLPYSFATNCCDYCAC
nr:hypothetical protein [Tanacetum cinerariifolium]